MHMLEALLGPAHHDIYDAILDMEMDDEYDIFSELEEDDEEGQLFNSRVHTRENSARSDISRIQVTDVDIQPSSAVNFSRRRTRTATTNWATLRAPWPRTRMASNNPGGFIADQRLTLGGYGAIPSTLAEEDMTFPPRENSGLARLYNSRLGVTSGGTEQSVLAANAQTNMSVKKVEALLTEVKSLPVNKLKDEMKEIQVRTHPSMRVLGLYPFQERQNRIESLLLMLTRAMRNDGLHHESY